MEVPILHPLQGAQLLEAVLGQRGGGILDLKFTKLVQHICVDGSVGRGIIGE